MDSESTIIQKDSFIDVQNTDHNTWHIHIEGLVQGVGFRPFVYRLAKEFEINGWVNNGSDGVHVEFNADNTQKPLDISREDFAHYVGTATESLIRTLSDFKSEKLIEIKEGKITVVNPEKLKNLLY